MDLLQLAKDATALFQQIEPGLASIEKAGAVLGTLGTAVVRVIQKGRQLVVYLVSRLDRGSSGAAPAPSDLVAVSDDEPITHKDDVAILVDINRRMLQDVARYLDEQKIDADLIIVTNDPTYGPKTKFLDVNHPDEWSEMVREFNQAWERIKHAVGGARVHIFLSTPLPLAFGLGSVWGTVDRAMIYHYDPGSEGAKYFPVMQVSRELRQ